MRYALRSGNPLLYGLGWRRSRWEALAVDAARLALDQLDILARAAVAACESHTHHPR
jgi:hypothetical protein